MTGIPERHRNAFNRRMRDEAQGERELEKQEEQLVFKAAENNPGTVMEGATFTSSKRVVFTEPVEGITEVKLSKLWNKSHVSSNGMIKRNGAQYAVTVQQDGETEKTYFERLSSSSHGDGAQEYFESVVPGSPDTKSIDPPF